MSKQPEHSREATSLVSAVVEHLQDKGRAQMMIDGWNEKRAQNSNARTYSHTVRVRLTEEEGRTKVKVDDAVVTKDECVTERQLIADDAPLFDHAALLSRCCFCFRGGLGWITCGTCRHPSRSSGTP